MPDVRVLATGLEFPEGPVAVALERVLALLRDRLSQVS